MAINVKKYSFKIIFWTLKNENFDVMHVFFILRLFSLSAWFEFKSKNRWVGF